MTSKHILITGPPSSGKTHLATNMMQSFPNAAAMTDCTDLKEIAKLSIHEELKLVVIEGITDKKQIEVISKHFTQTSSSAALIFTSQTVMEAPEGFTVINCQPFLPPHYYLPEGSKGFYDQGN